MTNHQPYLSVCYSALFTAAVLDCLELEIFQSHHYLMQDSNDDVCPYKENIWKSSFQKINKPFYHFRDEIGVPSGIFRKKYTKIIKDSGLD